VHRLLRRTAAHGPTYARTSLECECRKSELTGIVGGRLIRTFDYEGGAHTAGEVNEDGAALDRSIIDCIRDGFVMNLSIVPVDAYAHIRSGGALVGVVDLEVRGS
jgi:hypothetical protein